MWHVRSILACVAVIMCHGMEKPTAPVPGQIIYRVAWPLQQQFMYTETAGWVPVRGNTGTGLCNSDGSICVTEEKYGERDGQYLTFLYDTKNGNLMSGPLAGHFREFSPNGKFVVLTTAGFLNGSSSGSLGTLLLNVATSELCSMPGEDPHFYADDSRIILRASNGLNIHNAETCALLMRLEHATFKQFNSTGTTFAIMQMTDHVSYTGLYDKLGRAICIVPGFFVGFNEDGTYMLVNSDTDELTSYLEMATRYDVLTDQVVDQT